MKYELTYICIQKNVLVSSISNFTILTLIRLYYDEPIWKIIHISSTTDAI